MYYFSFAVILGGLILHPSQCTHGNAGLVFSNTVGTRQCVINNLPSLTCPQNNKYYSVDGTCNNPLNPYAGGHNLPFKRLVAPVYSNGVNAFRQSVLGQPLPLARDISNAFNDDNVTTSRDPLINAMHVTFGQIVAHDVTHAPPMNNENGVKVNCACSNPSYTCINVPIPSNDPFYGPETTCLPLKGSQTGAGCPHMPREQINALTPYLDAGNVYGSRMQYSMDLRDPDSESGELLLIGTKAKGAGCPFKDTGIYPSKEQIPLSARNQFSCMAHINTPACFAVGDRRNNENIGLSSLNLVLTRHHNKMARNLKSLNPRWSSDTCYNEARKIVIAIQQSITYGEYMEPLLGSKHMDQFDLRLLNKGYYYGYDPTFDATLSNAFSTAAHRYGHSQVGEFFFRLDNTYKDDEFPRVALVDGMFDTSAVFNRTSASIVRGLMIDDGFKTDLQFVSDIRNRMFESSTRHGEDLFAINLQRGREHGLAPYNQFREFCGLRKAALWSDFSDLIEPEIVEKLKYIYMHVDDVDLYAGGLAETSLDGALVGPTFACIMGYQFRDLRKGDRLWHENPSVFTPYQLAEIRKVTLAGLLCENMENMETVAPLAMRATSENNVQIPCSSIEKMSLAGWKETSYPTESEYTRWFVLNESPEKTFQLLAGSDPDSICTSALWHETKEINDDMFAIRYRCPRGSIRISDYPNAKPSIRFYWTSWFDVDSPREYRLGDDVETVERLRKERPEEICPTPLYMQAFTKEGITPLESNNIFAELNNERGLSCLAKHQPDGQPCLDYRVRFYCPNSFREEIYARIQAQVNNVFSNYVWTRWINSQDPRRKVSDNESVQLIRSTFRYNDVCRRPVRMEARISGSQVPASESGDVFKRYHTVLGLLCQNSDQASGQCHDYEVRYLCPPGSIRSNRS